MGDEEEQEDDDVDDMESGIFSDGTSSAPFTRRQSMTQTEIFSSVKQSAFEEGRDDIDDLASGVHVDMKQGEGYDVQRFEKSEDELKHFVCAVCCDIVKDPKEALCGHLYCGICADNIMKSSRECPQCRSVLTES